MVISSEFRMGRYLGDDFRENAQFRYRAYFEANSKSNLIWAI